jgi:hypothetical protein
MALCSTVQPFCFTVHLNIYYLWQLSGCEQAEFPVQKWQLMLRSYSDSLFPSTELETQKDE